MTQHPTPRLPLLPVLATALALLVAATPALAQYKVVGPDGKITYTDRPQAVPGGTQVQALRRDAAPAGGGGNSALPLELRTAAARFPVTLFTGSDCAPCDSARQLLRQRGVPYAERQVSSDEDIAALQRLSGGRSVPSLTVGSQALRGFLEADWQGTLDLAGYPKESKLPRGWAPPAATPLVARAPVADPVPSPPPAARAAAPVAEPAASGAIRF